MGLDIWLYKEPRDEDKWEETQEKSPNFPEHYSGPRYLRSSYNGSGYNSVVRNLIDEDLYSIFQPNDEEYYWQPSKDDLEAAKKRAVNVLEKLESVELPLGVDSVGFSPFMPMPTVTGREAIQIALEQLQGEHSFEAWSSAAGTFHSKGFEIVAAIPGRGAFGDPCVHLVFKRDITYYIEMTKIVIEFIDTALSFETPTIVWSG